MASAQYTTVAYCKPIAQKPITAQEIATILEVNQAICKAEAARRAGVSTAAVQKWIDNGRRKNGQVHYLPAAKWQGGDMVIILAADLTAWLREFPPMPQKKSRAKHNDTMGGCVIPPDVMDDILAGLDRAAI